MSGWQKGDLALCVRDGSWVNHNGGPRKGEIHKVVAIMTGEVGHHINPHPSNTCFLAFAPWLPISVFGNVNFRKVTPPKADEFDREVIDLMAGKKVVA
tara:strand:- start:38 stop:331 length:294 start_codon:yes stop_codon:yes gene_type:complete